MKNLSQWLLTSIITLVLSPTSFSLDGTIEEVPFHLHRGYMILVKGSLGPLENLTFLIDTGATSTVLSAHIAKKLKLEGKSRDFFAWGKQVESKTVILHGMRIGSLRFHSVPAAIADLSALPLVGAHIAAIVGLNALRRSSFGIDFQSRTISFGAVNHFDSWTPFDPNQRLLVVSMLVGNRRLRLLVDTGAKDLVLFRQRLKDFPSLKPTSVKKTIYHLGSPEEVRMVLLPPLQFGGIEWKWLKGFLLEGQVDGYPDIDGTLGISSLKLKRIHFDFQNELISWEKE